jgi:hypothetical protein
MEDKRMSAVFQQMGLVMFVVILFTNISLLSHDAAEVGITTTQGQSLGQNLTYGDLNTNFITQAKTVDANCTEFFCSTVNWASSSFTDFTTGLANFVQGMRFLSDNWATLVFGFNSLFMQIADSAEATYGPLHMLLQGISAIIYLMALYYVLIGIILPVASIMRGGGGVGA